VTHRTTNTAQGKILTRSAIAPLISAAVIAAKVIWKSTKMKFCQLTPCRPNMCHGLAIRSPLPLPTPSPPQPSDQPHSTNTVATRTNATNDIIIMLRTDLLRVMPP
jgi:hypothetical protein